jgi:hypothetical protein
MTATDTRATVEELLEAVFSVQSVPVLYKEDQLLLAVSPPCVEEGSNTSTVALTVEGGEEKGTKCLGI